MSHKTNTGLKGPRLFFLPGILIIFGLTSYLAFNQFILKPIAAASTVVVKIGETTYDLKIGKQKSASEK